MSEPVSDAEAMQSNLANWNSRVPVHTAPGGYTIDELVDQPEKLSDVVEYEQSTLGDLGGVKAVHLQCHIGTDTVSLAKLGAEITGLDFSPDAIDVARTLAERCGIEARFVVSNVYDAAEVLGDTYDLVYTGVGALNWLPDVGRWAEVVASLLRPGGRLHLFESHPMMETIDDDAQPDAIHLSYPYFVTEQPTRWEDSVSYAGEGEVTSPVQYVWAHGLGEVVQGVIDAGLVVTRLEEHRVLPWRLLDWFDDVAGFERWTQMPEHLRDVVPMSYTLRALKPQV